jgi:hypothetical protein
MDFLPIAKKIGVRPNSFGGECMRSSDDKLIAPMFLLHEARRLQGKERTSVLLLVTRIGDGEVIADLPREKQTIKTARLTGMIRVRRSSPGRVVLDTAVREGRRSAPEICRRGSDLPRCDFR